MKVYTGMKDIFPGVDDSEMHFARGDTPLICRIPQVPPRMTSVFRWTRS